jgi:hypothetical protein
MVSRWAFSALMSIVVAGALVCIGSMGARSDEGGVTEMLKTIRVIVHRDGSVNTAAIPPPPSEVKAVPKSDPDVIDGLRGYDDPDWTPGASPDYTTQQDFMRSIPDVQYVPPKTAVVHTGSSAKLRAEVAGLKSQVKRLDRIVAGKVQKPSETSTKAAVAAARAASGGSNLHSLLGQLHGLMGSIRSKLFPKNKAVTMPSSLKQPQSASSSTTKLDRVNPLEAKIEQNTEAIASMKKQMGEIKELLLSKKAPDASSSSSASSSAATFAQPTSASSADTEAMKIDPQYQTALATIKRLKHEVSSALDEHSK